jgi:hypothetical protein
LRREPRRHPGPINDDNESLEDSFAVPDAAPADVPAALRSPADPTRGAAVPGGNRCATRGRW